MIEVGCMKPYVTENKKKSLLKWLGNHCRRLLFRQERKVEVFTVYPISCKIYCPNVQLIGAHYSYSPHDEIGFLLSKYTNAFLTHLQDIIWLSKRMPCLIHFIVLLHFVVNFLGTCLACVPKLSKCGSNERQRVFYPRPSRNWCFLRAILSEL